MVNIESWVAGQVNPERFFKNKHEFQMLLRQLNRRSIGIGTDGVYQINYGFISQVSLLE